MARENVISDQLTKNQKCLIGITSRLGLDACGKNRCDCLAKDWGVFFSKLGLQWFILPNIGMEAVALVERCAVTGLVLSGGEDIGVHPERDTTEILLLDWACKNSLPVLGVCRGFQFMQHWLGGYLVPVDERRHVAAAHDIVINGDKQRQVNSYHSWGITSLASPLEAFAVDPLSGTIEAARWRNLLGIMWHPERYAISESADRELFMSHFDM